jgi:hypothetical protein
MRKLLLAAAIGALASATAVAQNASPNDPANGTAGVNDRMNSSPTQGGAAIGANPAPRAATDALAVTQAAPKDGPNFIQVQNTDMLSLNVVGLDVYNGQKDKIGKIQDVAFNASKQETGYILSVGQSNRDHGHMRRRKQDMAHDHQRNRGPAQGSVGIQVRRQVDGQQELRRQVGGTWLNRAPFRLRRS